MGIRDIEALETLSSLQQMELEQRFYLPANNQLLLFRSISPRPAEPQCRSKHE
jgi:hypothetical protein